MSFLVDVFKDRSFTKTQSTIAEYMIEHEVELCRMSLMDVSRAVGVSDASVLRFVRQIGYEGYNDFKEQLYAKVTEQIDLAGSVGKKNLRDRLSGSEDGQGLSLVENIAETASHNVELSLLQNPQSSYDRVLSSILRARTLYVFGARGTLSIAEHFSRLIRYLVGNVVFLSSPYDMHAALGSVCEDDYMIFFCTSRLYKSDLHICQAAQASGIGLCLITDKVPSLLTKFASHILITKTGENQYFNSMLGTLAVAEHLAYLLSVSEREKLQDSLDRYDLFTEEERISC